MPPLQVLADDERQRVGGDEPLGMAAKYLLVSPPDPHQGAPTITAVERKQGFFNKEQGICREFAGNLLMPMTR
jgi:hypothetical protein